METTSESTYTMVLSVPFYVSRGDIWTESAFGRHLLELEKHILNYAKVLLIVSPKVNNQDFSNSSVKYTKVSFRELEVEHLDVFSKTLLVGALNTIKVVKTSGVLHFGPTYNFRKPYNLIALLSNLFFKRSSIYVQDIDHRKSSQMLYESGKISRYNYLKQKLVFDKLISFQLKVACKYCSLILIKSVSAVEFYGKGRPNVKNFYNVAHDRDIIPTRLDFDRVCKSRCEDHKTKLVYFGRVVEYKGIKDMIEVVEKLNIEKGTGRYSLTIIGDGEQKSDLLKFVSKKNMESDIFFEPSQEYGASLIGRLMSYDALLACPKREDTPRSVFDAMAAGLPTFSYDTYYYRSLKDVGCVFTCESKTPRSLANIVANCKSNSDRYKTIREAAFKYAMANTQRRWVEKRYAWFDLYK